MLPALHPYLLACPASPQAQLEDVLFGIVRAKGFDEAHIDCYRMVTLFYQSRQPLCIIICGAAWTGEGLDVRALCVFSVYCVNPADTCFLAYPVNPSLTRDGGVTVVWPRD